MDSRFEEGQFQGFCKVVKTSGGKVVIIPDERDALRAAAPEMLEALKLFYDWSKNGTKYPPYWLQTTFVDKCSEIIAKAEGRQQ